MTFVDALELTFNSFVAFHYFVCFYVAYWRFIILIFFFCPAEERSSAREEAICMSFVLYRKLFSLWTRCWLLPFFLILVFCLLIKLLHVYEHLNHSSDEILNFSFVLAFSTFKALWWARQSNWAARLRCLKLHKIKFPAPKFKISAVIFALVMFMLFAIFFLLAVGLVTCLILIHQLIVKSICCCSVSMPINISLNL